MNNSRPLLEELLLTPEEAAESCGMSVLTLMPHVRAGRSQGGPQEADTE